MWESGSIDTAVGEGGRQVLYVVFACLVLLPKLKF